MKNRLISIALIAITASSLILSACQTKEPEADINAQKTGFAQTAEAQGELTAQAIPTATPTIEPTATLTPTTTPEESDTTPTPTATETGEAAEPTSPPSQGNDQAAWRANDPPDNTEFAPGEEFTVTWTLENTGSSTWTTNYYIQFSSGEQMEAEEKVFLPYPVPPNTNVQISVDFKAPESEGEKRSEWVLKNTQDQTFYTFYIIINVVEGGGGAGEPQPTNTPEPTATEGTS